MIESRLIRKAGYLQKIGLVEMNDSMAHVRGLSLLVSHPGEHPVEINVKISKPFPGLVEFARCACTGGKSGKCKHTVAVLRYLTLTTTIEPWTCTQGPCSWKNLKSIQKEILTPVPMDEFCHNVKTLKPLPPIPDFFNSEIFLATKKSIPENSAYAKEFKGRGTLNFVNKVHQLKFYLAHFPNTLSLYKADLQNASLEDLVARAKGIDFRVLPEDIKKIEEGTRGQSKNPNWLRFKKGRITASTTGQVMKIRSNSSNKSLMKCICYPTSMLFSTAATRHGCQHEKDAVKAYAVAYEKHRNLKIFEAGLHICSEYPFIGASPDAIVSCDCCEKRVLEVKCPYCLETKKKTMANLDYLSTPNGTLKTDHQYFYQVQEEMLCVGVAKADFMVWSHIEPPHLEIIHHSEDSY